MNIPPPPSTTAATESLRTAATLPFCRRTGALAATAPPLEFELTQPPVPSTPALVATPTLEESLWRMERALASGEMKATNAVTTAVRLLRKQVAEEEERMLQEDYALS